MFFQTNYINRENYAYLSNIVKGGVFSRLRQRFGWWLLEITGDYGSLFKVEYGLLRILVNQFCLKGLFEECCFCLKWHTLKQNVRYLKGKEEREKKSVVKWCYFFCHFIQHSLRFHKIKILFILVHYT